MVQKIAPTPDLLIASRPRQRCRQGLALALLYLVFATLVAVSSYKLSSLANTTIFMGLNIATYTSNKFSIPITVLLQGSTNLALSASLPFDAKLSLSTLVYAQCGKRNTTCANGFQSTSNQLWGHVAKALALVPRFDDPRFQDPTQTVTIQHINNMSGWNKPTAQISIAGHDMAITCMVKRATFYLASAPPSTAEVDSIAFCSLRKYDSNWVCENDADLDANTYAIRASHGKATYLGVAPRSDVYLNPGYLATFRNGASTMRLTTLTFFDEYERGILRTLAPWDVLPAASCATLNLDTGLGWLLHTQGLVTMVWESDALMLTNSVVLWLLTVYLVALQLVFLRHSVVCCVPVYMSKTVVDLAIVFVSFYGNANLQTLTTYLIKRPSAETPAYYKWLGPAQLASIVGITTGPLIQMWFNPRLVTQTWLLLVCSVGNWMLVFVLEAFVFPDMSKTVPGPCGHATSSNCFSFDAIARTSYLSGVAASGVVFLAILCVYAHSAYAASVHSSDVVPMTNSVLEYLEIPDFSSVLTSPYGVLVTTEDGRVGVDNGVLLVKNMLQVSDAALTRTSNVQYELLYRFLPTTWLRTIFSRAIGSIRIVAIEKNRILHRSSYKYLDEMALTQREFSPYYS
ncbi:hypothetical protein SPRG_03368 [Saprolegnia parasitica CBS 223.65]|uniref:Transmembrane protein n=1 Tax=Saprolegnia parasitica (strain CBS 223.65) TaxID=695850 RepID=A0A067D084_SAPPC|nr:hypothetical protein SPRG_03368 [Saprolegnia parasitica CBS 223.65]KDO32151.1 hypothetical protein SPRG_03368 [Saprolegnia parasitica CBS 223.65]|eukprot:XP_012197335.1 hypothetical protein SPRG_03368 [Saprolegnia parasitica CBS 223.65]